MKRLFLSLCIVITMTLIFTPLQTIQAQGEDLQVVRSSDGRVSIRLPADWETYDFIADEGYLVFGSTETAATGRLNDYNSEPALIVGEGGTLTVLAAADFGISDVNEEVVDALLDQVLATLEEGGGINIEEPAPYEIGDSIAKIAIIEIGNEKGFVGVIGFAEYVVLATSTGTRQSFEDNRALLEAIITSVRAPAEQGATADPGTVPTTESNLVRSSDELVSIVLPDGWLYTDEIETNNILAFGDSEIGMQSRYDVALADDPSTVVIDGSGGVVRLFDLAEVGIDPAAPDVTPLMAQIEQVYRDNGFDIIEPPTEFIANGGFTGQYLVFDSQAQYGYFMLVAFDEKLAFMTATSTPADFPDVQELLFSVVESVSVPAAPANEASDGGLGTKFPGLNAAGPGISLPEALSSPDGGFTVNLPQGWATYVDTTDTRFKAVLYFAENEDAVQVIREDLNPDEAGGIVFILDGNGITDTVDDLLAGIAPEGADLTKILSGEINGADARWIEYVLDADTDNAYQTFYVLMRLPNQDLALMILGVQPEQFEEWADILEAIFRSVNSETSGSLGSSGGTK